MSDSYKRSDASLSKGNYVSRSRRSNLARRPHPYFGKLNRLAPAATPPPGGGRGRAPAMTPDEQPGVLWQAIREGSEAD